MNSTRRFHRKYEPLSPNRCVDAIPSGAVNYANLLPVPVPFAQGPAFTTVHSSVLCIGATMYIYT
jgi:hypothetical protein